MPIITATNTKVIFGTGDISIQTGGRKHAQGIMQFAEVDSLAVGNPTIEKGEQIKSDDAPISLIFNNVESVKIVIEQLKNLQRVMEGDSYERTANESDAT